MGAISHDAQRHRENLLSIKNRIKKKPDTGGERFSSYTASHPTCEDIWIEISQAEAERGRDGAEEGKHPARA